MPARLSLLLLSVLLLLSAIRAGSVATAAADALPCASACDAVATTAQSAAAPLAADADAAEELLVAALWVPRLLAAAAHPRQAEPAPRCRGYRRPALRPPASAA